MDSNKERLPQHIKGNCPYCGKSLAISAASAAQALAAADARIAEQGAEIERLSMELQILQIAIRTHAAAQDTNTPF